MEQQLEEQFDLEQQFAKSDLEQKLANNVIWNNNLKKVKICKIMWSGTKMQLDLEWWFTKQFDMEQQFAESDLEW